MVFVWTNGLKLKACHEINCIRKCDLNRYMTSQTVDIERWYFRNRLYNHSRIYTVSLCCLYLHYFKSILAWHWGFKKNLITSTIKFIQFVSTLPVIFTDVYYCQIWNQSRFAKWCCLGSYGILFNKLVTINGGELLIKIMGHEMYTNVITSLATLL